MRHFPLGCVLAAVLLVTGCGDKAASPPKSTATPTATATAAAATPKKTATPAPALTSPKDLASCAVLEQAVQAVSQLVGHTTEGITQASNPKELAKQVGTAQQSLLDSAKLVELADSPKALVSSQHQFAQALRMFAADFGRGKAAAAKGDMTNATQLLTDEKALRKIQTSAKRIDDRCGA
jgi:hypothetical protein